MRIEVDSDYQVEDLDWVEVKHSSVVQEAAYFVVDPWILVFLLFLAYRRTAELGPGLGPEPDSDFDSDSGWRSVAVVVAVAVADSASFAEFAAAEAYAVMVSALDLVLVVVHVQAGREKIQVFLDQVAHVVLDFALVPVLVLEPLAFAFALDRVPSTLTQSSYSVDCHLLDSPSMKLPW